MRRARGTSRAGRGLRSGGGWRWGGGRRRGTVLIVTLTIVFVLAGMVLVFGRAMRVEAVASSNRESAAQARAIAYGAARAILELGDEAPMNGAELGGGAFWVLRPDPEDDRSYSFGLVDEASKLNLNTVWREHLLLLPQMTERAADAILEWRGEAEFAGAGAYSMLEEPYQAKGGWFESVEELLLVDGITPMELWGEDANRNGVLDENENDGGVSLPPDAGDGRLEYGLAPFVTVYSREPAFVFVGVDGEGGLAGERFNVNQSGGNVPGFSPSVPRRGEDVLREILEEALGADRAGAIASRIVTRLPHRDMIDLFYKSEMTVEEFHRVGLRLTTSQGGGVLGPINVNTAPREVLLALVHPSGEPVLTESEADALLAHRAERRASHGAPPRVSGAAQMPGGARDMGAVAGAEPHPLATVAWITEVLDEETAMAIGGWLTTRSYQYTADIVAVSGDGRAFERYRMVYDTSGEEPRVLHWSRLTHLGWPLGRGILDELRAGTPASELTRTAEWGRT